MRRVSAASLIDRYVVSTEAMKQSSLSLKSERALIDTLSFNRRKKPFVGLCGAGKTSQSTFDAAVARHIVRWIESS